MTETISLTGEATPSGVAPLSATPDTPTPTPAIPEAPTPVAPAIPPAVQPPPPPIPTTAEAVAAQENTATVSIDASQPKGEWNIRSMQSGYGPSRYWNAQDHIGRPHMVISTGEIISREFSIGVREGTLAAVFVYDVEENRVWMYEDTIISQQVIQKPLSTPGIYCGILQKPGKSYIWESAEEWDTHWGETFLEKYATNDPEFSISYTNPPGEEPPAPSKQSASVDTNN